MSQLKHFVIDADGDPEEIVDQVEFGLGKYEAAAEAEGGSVGTSSLTIMDPDGTFYMRGHRMMWDVETAAAADNYAGVTWAGFGALREISRGEGMFVDSARTTVVTRHDLNTILDRRFNIGNDCKRPGETAGVRLAWLMSTAEFLEFISSDTTYVDTADDTDMSEADYTGRPLREVLDDLAVQSGRNFFLFWLDSGDVDEPVAVFLWYNESGVADYASSIKISNLESDINSSTVFAPSQETVLRRDPSRVYSGVDQAYDGGRVYETNSTIASTFARRDTTGIAEHVRTAEAARRRARRQIADNATELDEIATAIVVPAASVNSVVHGHRIEVKFTHLPGYSAAFHWMRVKSRTVRTYTVGFYELALVLTGPSLEDVGAGEGGSGGGPGTFYALLSGTSGPYDRGGTDYVLFDRVGDDIAPAYATVGPIEIIDSERPGGPPWRGFLMTDTAVINVVYVASVIGIFWNEVEGHRVIWEIRKNDTVVANHMFEKTVVGLQLWATPGPVVSVEDLSVVAGDIITAGLVGELHYLAGFRTPWGVNPGPNNNRLEITGGT